MAQLNDVNAYIDEWTRVQLDIWQIGRAHV